MKRKLLSWTNAALAAVVLMLGVTALSYTAVTQIAGLSVAASSTKWNSVKDAGIIGDAATSGMLATSPMWFNGATFDRPRGDATNGLDVDVTRIQGGTVTPSDAFANPTNALSTWSLGALWNSATSQWERMARATTTSLITNQTTGVVPSALMGYNPVGAGANTYRPLRLAGRNRLAIQQPFSTATNITTNTSTLIDSGTANSMTIGRIIVGIAGAADSTIAVYREADGVAPCNGTLQGTFSGAVAGANYELGLELGDDFCILTASGGAAANITVISEIELN